MGWLGLDALSLCEGWGFGEDAALCSGRMSGRWEAREQTSNNSNKCRRENDWPQTI